MALNERELERLSKSIAKKDLVDGAYYKGDCRNADVARWNAKVGCFFYTRYKFGSTFTEDINHPEDDDGFDLFWPDSRLDEFTVIPPCPYIEKD